MDSEWLGLAGRVCVVTGAAGGIGAQIAATLAAARARVLLLDRAGCDQAVSAARATGGTAHHAACDVTDPVDVARAVQDCARLFGPCDVLVNNAAVLRAGALADLSLEDWNGLLAVNLTGYFLCAQAFGRSMREGGRGGSLVHMASISGHVPQPWGGAYSVSKAGIIMLSAALAVEWGGDGVRSNVVSPAMIHTPLSDPIYADPATRARRETMVPLGRIGAVQDIAEAVAFLASPRAGYITGQELVVDGGLQRNLLGLIPRPGFDRTAAGDAP